MLILIWLMGIPIMMMCVLVSFECKGYWYTFELLAPLAVWTAGVLLYAIKDLII